VYSLGYLISFQSDFASAYLQDPIPPVFAGISFVFLGAVFTFDRRIFETATKIEPSFTTNPAEYYGFFGHLIERIYEPWPFANYEGSRLFHPPTVALQLLGTGYVILLAVTGVGSPPTAQPLPVRLYLFSITLIGLLGLVIISWILIVTFVFMAFGLQDLNIKIVLTRSDDNLGLQPYGAFIVSITVRIFAALAIGGFATITSPSAFVISNFAFGSTAILIWFLGTQYGLHKSIVRAKQRYTNQLEEHYPTEVRGGRLLHQESKIGPNQALNIRVQNQSIPNSIDIQNSQSRELQDVQAVLEVKRRVDELPNWPVNTRNIIKLSGSVLASLLSVFGQPVYQVVIGLV